MTFSIDINEPLLRATQMFNLYKFLPLLAKLYLGSPFPRPFVRSFVRSFIRKQRLCKT